MEARQGAEESAFLGSVIGLQRKDFAFRSVEQHVGGIVAFADNELVWHELADLGDPLAGHVDFGRQE